MDRKSIAIIVACLLLMLLWPVLVRKFYPDVPIPPRMTNLVSSATNGVLSSGTNEAELRSTPGSNQLPGSVAPTGAPHFVVHREIPEELLVVTNSDARYTFTSRGGGLQEAQLLKYAETVSSRRQKPKPTNEVATLNSPVTPPVMAILGDESWQGDGIYKLSRTERGVRAEKTLPNGLTVAKDFQLGTNYLVTATVQIKNGSGQQLSLPAHELSIGTATPMGPQDNALDEAVLWYDGAKVRKVIPSFFNTNTTTLFIFPRTPQSEYREGSNNVVWASAQNQFFTLATMPTMPTNPAPGIVVRSVDLPPPTQEEINETPKIITNPKGLEASLTYPALTLKPGGMETREYNLFAGPKEYRTLARLADQFHNEIDLVMNFGWFGPISRALLGTMNWMHSKFSLDYGWLIIIITIIIKLIFWPLTQASTRSMKRMQALQPQIKALQEKYKDEPQKLGAKQLEFYKKNKVNPLSGCLPMVLQVPVFIAFYGMLRSAIELRGAHFLWIGDLSKPDTVFILPGLNFPINPMPLIMAASLFWQASMAPSSPGMDPSQQKIMKYMPLMMLFFMYNLSSGLALYWTVSNLLTILQTKLTRTQVGPAAVAKTPAPAPPQKKKK